MPSVSNQSCPNCGAPLPVQKAATQITCQFCGNVIRVEWTRQVPAMAQPLTLYVPPTVASAQLLLRVLVPVGLAMAFSVYHFAFNFNLTIQSPIQQIVQKAGLGTVTFPATCGLNQELEIIGQTYEGDGTLITGDVNCKVHIKDSKLKGTVVVLAKNLVEVTVENSTLTGTEAAIKTEMNSKIDAKRNSVILGKVAAIDAGLNTGVTLTDSRVEGQELGIKTALNFELTAKGASIVGKQYAVRSEGNMKASLTGTNARGERSALFTGYNLELEMHGGKLEGNEAALTTTDANANIRLSDGAEFVAKETALKTGSNLELSMEDATLRAEETAIDAGVNPKLHLSAKARITGKRFALKLGHNLELEMRNATIDSDQVALCTAMNAQITARDSTIRGGIEAFRMQRKPEQLELVSTQVTGRQNFSGKGCSL